MSYFKNAVRAGLAAATVASLAIGIALLVPKCSRCRQLEDAEAAQRAANQAVDTRIREVRHDINDYNTNAASVERVARMEGMIRPDEVKFKFTPAATDAPVRATTK